MDGRTDGRMDGWTDRRRDGQMHRFALYSTLKNIVLFESAALLTCKTNDKDQQGGAREPLTIYCLWATGFSLCPPPPLSLTFEGHFNKSAQEMSVPSSLKTLIAMLCYGPALQENESKVCLTICQLIYLNSRKQTAICHKLERKTPLYLGLMFLSETRSRILVDKLCSW